MERFLIFALERSGSSSLASALNTGRSVVQEPFSSMTGDITNNPDFVRLLEASRMMPEHLPAPPEGPFDFNRFSPVADDRDRCRAYLDRLYGRFTGIKHVWNTVSAEANLHILEWCFENQIRAIHLSRRKLAHALVSRHLAQQANVHDLGPSLEFRGRWERTVFQPVDVEALRGELDSLREAEERYRDYLQGKPHFPLLYERLFRGPLGRRRRVFARLCSFLSADADALDHDNAERYLFASERKQTRREHLKRVPNYRQLKRML